MLYVVVAVTDVQHFFAEYVFIFEKWGLIVSNLVFQNLQYI